MSQRNTSSTKGRERRGRETRELLLQRSPRDAQAEDREHLTLYSITNASGKMVSKAKRPHAWIFERPNLRGACK